MLLLLVRLTYGCHKKWAKLKQCDLAIVGISETHAKEVLVSLLKRGIIIQNGKTYAFSINEEKLFIEVTKSVRCEKLDELIGKQLKKETSQKGKAELTETVSKNLPNEEVTTSQNGKLEILPKREVFASYANNFKTPKDILKINKYSDKDSIAVDNSSNKSFQLIHPKEFKPSNEGEAAAYEAWNQLEYNNPLAFSTTYYPAYKYGLPAALFYQFVSEIKQDKNIKNAGAIFNSKVKE